MPPHNFPGVGGVYAAACVCADVGLLWLGGGDVGIGAANIPRLPSLSHITTPLVFHCRRLLRIVGANLASIDGMKTITLEQAIDKYEEDLAVLFEEQYWENGVDTEAAFNYLIKRCKRDACVIDNVDYVDYDHPLYAIYNSRELGLS